MQGYLPWMWGTYGPVTGDVSRKSDVDIKGSSRYADSRSLACLPLAMRLCHCELCLVSEREERVCCKNEGGENSVLPREKDRVELCLRQPIAAWQLSILRITYGYSYREEAPNTTKDVLVVALDIIESTHFRRPRHQQIYVF